MSEQVTVDLRDSNRSPVHIHLTDDMPVHVHVKREKNKSNARRKTPSVTFGSGILKTDSGFKSNSGVATYKNPRLTVAERRSRSPTSLQNGREVVRPLNKGRKLSSKTKLTRSASEKRALDRTGSSAQGLPLDTASDIENYVTGDRNGSARSDAYALRSGSLTRTGRSDQSLDDSFRSRDDYDDISRDIKRADVVNKKLRRSIEALNRSDAELLLSSTQNDKVQRKLLEIEMESQAIANQVSALNDTLRFLKEDKRLAPGDSTMLMKHKELLEDRLERFSAGSVALRKLMTYQQDQDALALRLAEQRDKLLERLAKTQNSQQDVISQLFEKDEEIVDLRMQLDAHKEELKAIQGLQSSTAATKAHLQKELKTKDADCNRLSVQIRTLEGQLAQERIDVDHLRKLLVKARTKPDEDKEALKKATRVQKLRAARSEDAAEQMRAAVLERDTAIEELKVELETLRTQNTKLSREKEQSLSALKTRVNELEGLLERQDDRSRHQVTAVTTRLEEKSAELTALRRDNDKLRSMCASDDNKLSQKDEEISELRAKLKESQALRDEYRTQLEEQRRESRARMEGQAEFEEIDHQTGQLLESKARLQKSDGKLDNAERRLSHLEDENRELIGANAKREEAARQMSARLEEKIKENASLQRQLDSANSELRRLKELELERSTTTERTLQTKILELDSQLGQTRSEVAKLKRDRDDMERKFNSKVYDLKDRLEQSHATNRSMQNYVQFLKNSYTSAFNDATLGPTTSTPQRAALY